MTTMFRTARANGRRLHTNSSGKSQIPFTRGINRAERPVTEPLPGVPMATSDDDAIDLDVGEKTAATLESDDAVKLRDYDPEPVRDQVRGQIALFLIGILALMVALSFLLLYAAPWHTERLVTLLQILFGPVATLVGAATGYYFGANSSKPK